MGLAQWIQMDEKGLRNEWNKNPKILEDVLEALIGAIYLDLGILHAKQFIFHMLIEHPVDLDLDDNYKDQLMRLCQSNKKPLPLYKVESFINNIYSIHVIVDDIVVGKGTGGNKKVAEQEAAKEALKIYTF
jgi:ribonuclease-3